MELAHGRFELDWQGDVLVVRVIDDWNEFGVQNLQRAALASRTRHATKPWAMLVDAREWGLATPEALAQWPRFIEAAHEQGLVAVARVLPSQFHEVVVREIIQRTDPLVQQASLASPEAAWDWLRDQGFSR